MTIEKTIEEIKSIIGNYYVYISFTSYSDGDVLYNGSVVIDEIAIAARADKDLSVVATDLKMKAGVHIMKKTYEAFQEIFEGVKS